MKDLAPPDMGDFLDKLRQNYEQILQARGTAPSTLTLHPWLRCSLPLRRFAKALNIKLIFDEALPHHTCYMG